MKWLNQEEIKKELVDSLVNSTMVEMGELNEQAWIVDNPEDAADQVCHAGFYHMNCLLIYRKNQ